MPPHNVTGIEHRDRDIRKDSHMYMHMQNSTHIECQHTCIQLEQNKCIYFLSQSKVLRGRALECRPYTFTCLDLHKQNYTNLQDLYIPHCLTDCYDCRLEAGNYN